MVIYKTLPWEIERANQDSVNLQKANAGKGTRNHSENRDVIGSLGQWVAHRWLTDEGIEHEFSLPFDPTLAARKIARGDSYDVMIPEPYKKVDIKASPIYGGDPDMVELHVLEAQQYKRLDYLFVRVARDYTSVQIIGGVNYENFWMNGHDAMTESKYGMKYPGKFFYAKDVISPLKFIKQ